MGAQWKQKHRAAAADAKGRLFGRLVKEIHTAARGGADPSKNAALRMALDNARKHSLPRDTLERAVKKGAGLLGDAINYELVTYEGFGPHQVATVVECLTDNRNRTATNIRIAFHKNGGQLAAQGAVCWDFTRCGMIEAQPPAAGEDPDEAAIEAGADDVQPTEDGGASFITEPTTLSEVSVALEARGWQVSSAKLAWMPNNPVTLPSEATPAVEAFLDALDADGDVQNIYVALEG